MFLYKFNFNVILCENVILNIYSNVCICSSYHIKLIRITFLHKFQQNKNHLSIENKNDLSQNIIVIFKKMLERNQQNMYVCTVLIM